MRKGKMTKTTAQRKRMIGSALATLERVCGVWGKQRAFKKTKNPRNGEEMVKFLRDDTLRDLWLFVKDGSERTRLSVPDFCSKYGFAFPPFTSHTKSEIQADNMRALFREVEMLAHKNPLLGQQLERDLRDLSVLLSMVDSWADRPGAWSGLSERELMFSISPHLHSAAARLSVLFEKRLLE
jgi:hypothetical protein